MAEVEIRKEFAVPPREIFPFFVPQRMPLWYGAEMGARFEAQGRSSEFSVGQKIRITGKLGKREVSLTLVVTACEWERLLEWRFQDSYGVRGMQRWELSLTLAGTRVVMRDSYEMPSGLGKFLDRVFTRRAVARRDCAWMDRLQRLAERR
jgi:hypothetical protein